MTYTASGGALNSAQSNQSNAFNGSLSTAWKNWNLQIISNGCFIYSTIYKITNYAWRKLQCHWD